MAVRLDLRAVGRDDAAVGREFRERCGRIERLAGRGQALGPALAPFGEVAQLLPAWGPDGEGGPGVLQPQAELLAAVQQPLAHLPQLGADLRQVERHAVPLASPLVPSRPANSPMWQLS